MEAVKWTTMTKVVISVTRLFSCLTHTYAYLRTKLLLSDGDRWLFCRCGHSRTTQLCFINKYIVNRIIDRHYLIKTLVVLFCSFYVFCIECSGSIYTNV